MALTTRQASMYNALARRKARRAPASGMFITHRFSPAADIDTAAAFPDSLAPVSFAFALSRTGAGGGVILEFGSAARGLAVWVDGADLGVAAGAGLAAPDDGASVVMPSALPLALATGKLTFTGNAGNGQTITIGSRVYTFQTVLTNVAGNVLIGASASDSIDNLIAAINAGAGAGVTYAAATTAHPDVTALAGAGDTMDVTAKAAGTRANTLFLKSTVAGASWNGPQLSGGCDPFHFVVSIVPGLGLIEVFRGGAGIGRAVAVNGSFNGGWSDADHGGIGAPQGAINDRVPIGQRIALANVALVGSLTAYSGQRVWR